MGLTCKQLSDKGKTYIIGTTLVLTILLFSFLIWYFWCTPLCECIERKYDTALEVSTENPESFGTDDAKCVKCLKWCSSNDYECANICLSKYETGTVLSQIASKCNSCLSKPSNAGCKEYLKDIDPDEKKDYGAI